MYSTPVGVVPKPHSDKLQMVVDQSAEPFSQNSMIAREDCYVQMDTMRHLGAALRCIRSQHPERRLVVFKSDISRAYRLIPVHPLWQIRQVVSIHHDHQVECHVNRCNHFGNGAGGRCFACFAGLVAWITIFIVLLEDVFTYVDDNFSYEFEDELTWYEPYDKLLPTKQARLLCLWDELGIPHEERKQEWGTSLTIIGFHVDPNQMTVSMPLEYRNEMTKAIREFAHIGQRRSLREFQRMAGWINWSLNVYPLLRPGLSMLYSKMSGKSEILKPIWVNATMVRELHWLADHVDCSDGVHILESTEWSADDASLTVYTDACLTGLGFWIPKDNTGFTSPVLSTYPIFFLEALAVLSTLHHICNTRSNNIPARVAIFCDNSNTVDMFNTLRASPEMNGILLAAIDLTIEYNLLFRVFHIAGDANTVADALSRADWPTIACLTPLLRLQTFQPPPVRLGCTR
jgi:hypothetical protein